MFAKLFLFSIVAVVACSALDLRDYYSIGTSKFDVYTFVGNIEVFKIFQDCVIGDGECSPPAASFKEDFTEALRGKCEKCSDEGYREVARKIVLGLKERSPVQFVEAVNKIDPEGKHWFEYEKLLFA